MACCCVKSCRSSKKFVLPTDNISFHRVKKSVFRDYMKAIGSTQEEYSIKVICSLHFNDDDFVYMKDRKYLKKTARPTRNLTPKLPIHVYPLISSVLIIVPDHGTPERIVIEVVPSNTSETHVINSSNTVKSKHNEHESFTL